MQIDTYLRLLVWLDDQWYEEVQNGIDEEDQKNDEEELAEHKYPKAIIYTHPSEGVPEIISIQQGEEGVEWLIIVSKLKHCVQERNNDKHRSRVIVKRKCTSVEN